MKRIYSWAVVLVIVVIISITLFVTGKQHKVFVYNGKKGEKDIPKIVEYSIDGGKYKKLKATKKGVVNVKGKGHTLVLKYKNSQGKEIEIVKKFNAKVEAIENIDLFKVINGKEDYIKYEIN